MVAAQALLFSLAGVHSGCSSLEGSSLRRPDPSTAASSHTVAFTPRGEAASAQRRLTGTSELPSSAGLDPSAPARARLAELHKPSVSQGTQAGTPRSFGTRATVPGLGPVRPLTPEETDRVLEDVGDSFVYGQGIGEAALNVGTTVLFPPFGVYVLVNGVLTLTGHEPLRFSDALPEEGSKAWREVYGDVTSGPGKFVAAAAGKEFVTPERAKERLENHLRTIQLTPAPPASPGLEREKLGTWTHE